MLQQREGKPKALNAVVAGMNVELLSADSQRVIVRVRKLVVYLSSSQATSKTAKLPKAQRVPPHEENLPTGVLLADFLLFQGCAWPF